MNAFRTFCAGLLGLAPLSAQVVLVEPGHFLVQHVDSAIPLDPTQPQLDVTAPNGNLESIAIDPVTGDLFVQLIDTSGAAPSLTTHVFRVVGGVVTPVAINTGLGINERGTDMHFDTVTGLLVTMDDTFLLPPPPKAGRLMTINPASGAIGLYSNATLPVFSSGTFGMDFSKGFPPGADVPPGDIVFTSDVAAAGIHSVTFAGPGSVTHVGGAALPGGGAGDDMVVQPDGDWVWVGDFNNAITQVSPIPPHPATATLLDIATMAGAAGLPFTAGSRAAVCDITGDIYVSYSAATGGHGIWRVDEALTTATLVLTVGIVPGGPITEGIHDLVAGPSSLGIGSSVYFTVHDLVTGGEEVWEVTATKCCPVFAITNAVPDATGLNAPASLMPFPPFNRPTLGNLGFAMVVDEPAGICPITLGSSSFVLVGFAPSPAPLIWPTFGCAPGLPGEFQIGFGVPPVALGPVAWPGPGLGAIHPLPVPLNWSLCGSQAFTQGIWLDFQGPAGPAILTTRLDLTLGS